MSRGRARLMGMVLDKLRNFTGCYRIDRRAVNEYTGVLSGWW